MSYAPTEWKSGDVITAEKLNNIENGVVDASKPLFVSLVSEDDGEHFTASVSSTDIESAIESGIPVFAITAIKFDGMTAVGDTQGICFATGTLNTYSHGILVHKTDEYEWQAMTFNG